MNDPINDDDTKKTVTFLKTDSGGIRYYSFEELFIEAAKELNAKIDSLNISVNTIIRDKEFKDFYDHWAKQNIFTHDEILKMWLKQ